ncbi:hypothetical protein JMJ77_0012948 [Colletotrichum scovillei]|uniref:Uncharacterized protein n=1 Tax=Colletotrichum scovillei TaxID=1209932 RepID=A0A9P7UCL2_9PEZI|nr:hypothetical protein JMJ77_0012948 [Colletotrichum scovillei]KAG7069235.1 hypothetical protein JMJ76_0002908 [Colletotrichum scovillei]KAG7073214.1 hypothetical protein JMJ78_0014193 [Colletotrichum scovillei]
MGIREPWAGHQDGLPPASLSRNLQCPVLPQKPHIVAAARYPPVHSMPVASTIFWATTSILYQLSSQ